MIKLLFLIFFVICGVINFQNLLLTIGNNAKNGTFLFSAFVDNWQQCEELVIFSFRVC